MFALVLGLVAADPSPIEKYISQLSALEPGAADEKLVALVDPDAGLVVDVAAEGARTPVWVTLKRTSKAEDVRKALLPVVSSGVFKATPFCKTTGSSSKCTFMTTASLPRVCTIVERKSGFFLSRIEWQEGRTDPEDGDDDDLPM